MRRLCGRWLIAPAVGLIVGFGPNSQAAATDRVEQIRDRGHLTCGVKPQIAGFASVDSDGRYAGFEIDFCRALSAAIFGKPDQVRFVTVESVEAFRAREDIDVVARRLTWTLTREARNGLLFSPVIFHDGGGFLVAAEKRLRHPSDLSGRSVCVRKHSETDEALQVYFERFGLDLAPVRFDSPDAATAAFLAGKCVALAGHVSTLAAIRAGQGMNSRKLEILPEMISREPLALLMRQADEHFFLIARWTVFALIEAEELNVSSHNVVERRRTGRQDVRWLLGPETGNALDLDQDWVLNVIQGVGNYGEIYARHLGSDSPIGLERGLNRLWTAGGLLYAPPVR